MTTPTDTSSGAAWDAIERDKRVDRFVRRVCATAWGATFVVLLAFAVVTGIQVVHLAGLARVGAVTNIEVVSVAMPFVTVIGTVSLLIAILSTVGIFLRLRTASLSEIQLRLAALEDILTRRGDA